MRTARALASPAPVPRFAIIRRGLAMDDGVRALADLLRAADRVLVFTGAGMSTESGIPDFRSPGGIWDRYPIVYHDEFLRDPEAQRRYWLRSRETYPVIAAAQPNSAH